MTGGGGGSTTTGGGVGGGGTTTGGGGGSSTTGGGGGSTTGGGGGTTGGGTGGGGGSATFSWTRMTFNPAPGLPSVARRVVGLGRRGNGETWVALGDGSVWRAVAGSEQFSKIPNFPAPTTTTELLDLSATTDEVLIIRGQTILSCAGTCADFSDFVGVKTITFGEDPIALCTRGARALFTTQQSTTTLLYEAQRSGNALTGFTAVSQSLGVGGGERCTIAENGDVWIPGSNGVAVLRAAGGVGNEAIDLMGQPGARWTAVAMAGATGLAVGGGSGYRFAQRVGTTWNSLAPNTAGPLMNTVLALSSSEFFAGGETNGGSSTLPAFFRWNGAGFVPLSGVPAGVDAHRGLVVSANEVYFGGAERDGSAYVVLHGVR